MLTKKFSIDYERALTLLNDFISRYPDGELELDCQTGSVNGASTCTLRVMRRTDRTPAQVFEPGLRLPSST
jgi:hypothetical protein